MRCPKCQYVGFEPSPRCKNCGYDLSLGSAVDQASERMDDDAPSLTLVIEDEREAPMADFELQIFDDVTVKKVQGGAKAFDLDDLLANGPASGSAASRESEPVIQAVSAVARRRQSAASASASAPAASSSSSSSSSASAVATPPPMEIEALFKPAPAAKAPAVKAPVVEAPLVHAPVIQAPVEPPAVEAPVVEAPVVEAPVVETVAAAASVPPVPPPASAPAPPAPVTTELPLFMQGMSEISAPPPVKPAPAGAGSEAEIDDRPLVQVPASPRAPLAVRRTTPDPARLRAKYSRAARAKAEPSEVSGDLPLNAIDADASDAVARVDPRIVPPVQRMSAEPTPASLPAEWLPGVGPAKRLMAAALDGALLVSLDAAVVWFTLSVCGLAPGQANLLPIAPLLLFFLLLDAGYLVLFTAACGQTLGKMAAGIRVVGTTTGAVINDRITISQALMRSVGSIASMLPLGAGFWFALVGDRRAAHDRLAHTRVVAQ